MLKEYEYVRIIFSFFTALGLSVYFLPMVVEIALKKNMVDLPNGRTAHSGLVPNLGGMAIFGAVMVASLIFWKVSFIIGLQYRIVGMFILFFIGFQDDVLGLDHWKKFFLETCASLFVIAFGGVRLTSFHGFLGIYELDYVPSILVSLFVFLLVLNSYNLIDGIDGLAAGIGIMATLFFGLSFYAAKTFEPAVSCSAVAGGLAGFYYFNVFGKKYKIFMGDSGSLFIGFTLAILTVRFNEINKPGNGFYHLQAAPVVSMAILALPLYDTLRVMIIRIMHKQSPFKPDRRHMHHMLLELGMTHFKASTTLIAINSGIALLIFGIQFFIKDIFILALILTAIVLILTLIPYKLLRDRRKKLKDLKKSDFDFLPAQKS